MTEVDRRRLVFVYKVDASPVALLRDLVTGLRTGSTGCHLCDLTFGSLLKDPEWKAFVAELPLPVDFSLRSTFLRRHRDLSGRAFPSAWLVEGGSEPVEVLSASDIEAVSDLDGLRVLVADTVAGLAG